MSKRGRSFSITDLSKPSSLPIVAGIATALVDNTVLPSPNLKLLELFSSTTFSKSSGVSPHNYPAMTVQKHF